MARGRPRPTASVVATAAGVPLLAALGLAWVASVNPYLELGAVAYLLAAFANGVAALLVLVGAFALSRRWRVARYVAAFALVLALLVVLAAALMLWEAPGGVPAGAQGAGGFLALAAVVVLPLAAVRAWRARGPVKR